MRVKRNGSFLTGGGWLLRLSGGRVTKIRDQREKLGNPIQTLEVTLQRYQIMLGKKRGVQVTQQKRFRNAELFNLETKTQYILAM